MKKEPEIYSDEEESGSDYSNYEVSDVNGEEEKELEDKLEIFREGAGIVYTFQYNPWEDYFLDDYLHELADKIFEGTTKEEAKIKSINFITNRLSRVLRIITGKEEMIIVKESPSNPLSIGFKIDKNGRYGKFNRGKYLLRWESPLNKLKKNEGKPKQYEEEPKFPFDILINNSELFSSRSIVNKIIFTEDEKRYNSRDFNMFVGFRAQLLDISFKESEEILKPILDHIFQVWACSNKEYFNWIMELLTYTIRTGEKPNKMLVLMGPEGVGKSLIMDFLKRHVLGDQLYIEFSGVDKLTRGFNMHLVNKVFVCINESLSVGSSRREALAQAETLKQIITGDKILVEPKGKDVYQANNYITNVLFSNNPHPVIVTEKNRRIGIFKTIDEIRPKKYFDNLITYFTDYMGDVFYTYCRKSKPFCNINNIPQTETLKEIVQNSKPRGVLFFEEVLVKGTENIKSSYLTIKDEIERNKVTGENVPIGKRIPYISVSDFYKIYLDWHKFSNNGERWGKDKFSKELKKYPEIIHIGDKNISGHRATWLTFEEDSFSKIRVLPEIKKVDENNMEHITFGSVQSMDNYVKYYVRV